MKEYYNFLRPRKDAQLNIESYTMGRRQALFKPLISFLQRNKTLVNVLNYSTQNKYYFS